MSIYLGYPEFGRHLNNTGRPMVYSCSWPAYQEEKGMLVSILTCKYFILFIAN